MNRTLKLILISGLAALGAACTRGTKPRVAIVGIGIECSTFSPARTTLDMFRPIYGDDILKSYPFFREDTALRLGLNVVEGKVTYRAVADVFSMPWQPVEI